MGSSELETPSPAENKNKAKTYSISLTPNEAEAVKELGYNLSEVAKIGVKTVLFQKSFLVNHFPLIAIEVGIGLLLLSFSVTLSNNFIILSYALIFTALFFIVMASVTALSLVKVNNIRRKNGKSK